MNGDIISIPTKNGWRYARWGYEVCDFVPAQNASGSSLLASVTQAEIYDEISPLAHPVETVNLFVSSQIVDSRRPARALVGACIPHLLKDYLDSPDSVPRTKSGEINLKAWLQARNPHQEGDLAEVLDGGRGEYLCLCREDILRILLRRYDDTPIQPRNQPFQVPDAAEMTVVDIWSSPLKRRYYAEGIWRSEAARLYGEKIIAGHGDGGPFWIDPQVADVDALRERVEEYDRSALEGTQRSSAPKRFFQGESSEAWQEIRRIVRAAAQHVWIEDAYVGSDVVALLTEDLPESAKLRVLGPAEENKWWNGALASLRRLGADLPRRIEVRVSEDVHERYIYVDGNAWRLSESFKDMGAKRTTRITDEGERSAERVADFQKRWDSAKKVFPA